MNTSNKHLPMSESASAITAVASAITLAVRRTESTVLRNIIVAAALLVVILLVAFGQSTRSEADPASSGPPPNHNASHSAFRTASLPAWLAGTDIFATRNGYAEFTGELHGTVGVFAGDSRRLGGTVDLRTGAFDFHLYLKTLSTGIPDRDSGLQNALNTENHPFAEFTGTFHPAFNPQSSAKQNVTAAGEFTLNGVTRYLEIPATLQAVENGIHLEAEWVLDITEFGIQPPAFLSVTVSDEQEIRLQATLEPQMLVSN